MAGNEFKGPQLTRGRSTRNSLAGLNLDGVSLIIAGGDAVVDGVDLNKIYELLSIDDARNIKLDTAYDVNGGHLVFEHIYRFFTINPNGKLYIKLVPKSLTLLQIVNEHLLSSVLDIETRREIKLVGICHNPDSSYIPDFVQGYEEGLIEAVDAAQAKVEELLAQGYYLPSVAIEGRMQPNAVLSSSRDWRAEAAPNVSIVAFQDPAIAKRGGFQANYGDIGSFLGHLSIRRVSESVGSVDIANKPLAKLSQETFPLTDRGEQLYIDAALSSGKRFSDLNNAELNALGNRGVIYAGAFAGFDGFYINNGHVCAPLTGTYAYIEDNRVWCKAASIARAKLIPTIRGNFGRNADGTMRNSYKSYLQELIRNGLKVMITSGEIEADPAIEVNENPDGSGIVRLGLKYIQEGVQRELKGVISPL
jgi:hypothetical protein